MPDGATLWLMDLPIGDAFTIPESELDWTFTTSGGPGGQHANRSATSAQLAWDLGSSGAISAELKERLRTALGSRVRNGVITVSVAESRSQWRNRQLARRRLAEMLEQGLRERRRRIPTRVPRAAHDSRIKDKRRRGATKRLRRPPELDES